MKYNTIGKGEKQRAVNGGLDKYYTKKVVAEKLAKKVIAIYGEQTSYIEPTAGNGVFMDALPNVKGYDLHPEREDIVKCDVFENSFSKDDVIVGNPPFGMNASLAIKIFNHIAKSRVKAICFIVPKTFKKDSTKNRLSLDYTLVYEEDLGKNSFTVEGKDKNVPCVFQIWELQKRKKKDLTPKTKYIEFTTKDEADIAIRRAGGRAGQLLDGLDHSVSSTYFIKVKDARVYDVLKHIDLSCTNHTAGVRSISKYELCEVINAKIND